MKKKKQKDFETLALQLAHRFFQERKRAMEVNDILDEVKMKLEVIKSHFPNPSRLFTSMLMMYVLIIIETIITSKTMEGVSLNLSGESNIEDALLFHYLLTFLYAVMMIVFSILTGKYFYYKKHIKLEAAFLELENPSIISSRLEVKLYKGHKFYTLYGLLALFMLIGTPIAMHIFRVFIINNGHASESLMVYIPLLIPTLLVICLVYLSQFKTPCMLYYSTNKEYKQLSKKKEEHLENAREAVLACKMYSNKHTQIHGKKPFANAQIKSCLAYWEVDFSSDEILSDESPRWIEVSVLYKYKPVPGMLVMAYTADETSFQVQTNQYGKAKLYWKSATPYLLSVKVNGVALNGNKFPHEQNITVTLEELEIELPPSLTIPSNGVHKTTSTI